MNNKFKRFISISLALLLTSTGLFENVDRHVNADEDWWIINSATFNSKYDTSENNTYSNGDISITAKYVRGYSSKIEFNKTNGGYIYNTTPFSSINSIVLNKSSDDNLIYPNVYVCNKSYNNNTDDDFAITKLDSDSNEYINSTGYCYFYIVSENSKAAANPKCSSIIVKFNNDNYKAVSSISFDKTNISVLTGRSTQLTTTVLSDDATNKSYSLSSQDTSIATVTEDGIVTGISEGATNIVATSDDYLQKTATCSVTVSYPEIVNSNGFNLADDTYLSDSSAEGWTPSFYDASETSVLWKSKKINVTLDKNTSKSDANLILCNGTFTQFYAGQIITITPNTNYKLNSITFNCTNSTYAANFSSATITNGDTSRDSALVTITPTDLSSDIIVTIGSATRVTSISFDAVLEVENNVESYFSLGYSYSYLNLKNVDVSVSENASYTGQIIKKSVTFNDDGFIDFTDAFDSDSLFNIFYKCTSTFYCYINKTSKIFKFYNGSIWKLDISDSLDYEIYEASIVASETYSTSDLTTEIADDKKSVTFTYSGSANFSVTSFSIILKSKLEISNPDQVIYSNVDFRLGLGIDKSSLNSYKDSIENCSLSISDYGINLVISSSDSSSLSTTSLNISFTSSTYSSYLYGEDDSDQTCIYTILKLGDALNNATRLSDSFTIKFYATVDGDTYYGPSKTHSIASLVSSYYSDESTKSSVTTLYNQLVRLGYITNSNQGGDN